jgi:hypothetical protein
MSNYTLNDIQTLLFQKYPKLKWNYEIYERSTGEKRQAEIEDFTENMQYTLALACTYKDNEYSLDVSVSDFAFLVYEDEPNIMGSGSTQRLRDDFTNDWTNLLLAEHGYDYANSLINYCEKRKKQINENAMQEITKQVQKIKARAELKSLPYEKLIQKAQIVLPSSDFMEKKES